MGRFSELGKDELEALYKGNATMAIARTYGVCQETVRKRLKALGIARPRGSVRTFNPSAKELNDLYQAMSMAQIAEKFQVGETVVWKRLQETELSSVILKMADID